MENKVSALRIIGGILAFFFAIWLLVFVISWAGARATPQAGEIGVVRGGPSTTWIGAWFNGHGVKGIIAPGSGSTYVGLGSEVHYYPDSSVQRNYTISANPNQGDAQGVDIEEVPTSDGVRVGLEGTFFFTTAFDSSSQGKSLVKAFDSRFGIRQFQLTNGSPALYPWEQGGWAAFLSSVVRPIIDNDLRRAVASVTCAQLISSCALVHQQSAAAITSGGKQNNATIQAIQDQINSTLQSDVASTLGKDYFSNIQFLVQRVTLPGAIQNQIDQAQAQYAAVGTAQAQVQQAKLQSQANSERQRGYANCPACAAIDQLKAIPSNVTTFAPGAGFAITTK